MNIAWKALGMAAVIPLSACVPTTPEGETALLSEEVRAVVRPGQDISSVRVQTDGCYWWLYEGVVEDTYIPLETRDGRMICTRGAGINISEFDG
ncbi:MAG: hypothetical protein AAGA70_06080 [Pseudomonadota bacterium]